MPRQNDTVLRLGDRGRISKKGSSSSKETTRVKSLHDGTPPRGGVKKKKKTTINQSSSGYPGLYVVMCIYPYIHTYVYVTACTIQYREREKRPETDRRERAL